MSNPIDKLRELFTEALAWGAVYGPIIPNHQWDEMRDRMTEQFLSRANEQKEAGGQDANPAQVPAPAFKGLDADAERCSPDSAMSDERAFKILHRAEGYMSWTQSIDYRWAVDYLSQRVAQQPAASDDELPGMWSHSDFTGGATDARDSGEFGCGIKPNPKARYWQERADFWRAQAVALGWRAKRECANELDAALSRPAGGESPMPMESAPRDGTMLRLLVEFDDHATEDVDGPAWTIGANNFDNDGDDEWLFAGWCWTHDHFTQGTGRPVGWLPMLAAATTPHGGEDARDAERYRKIKAQHRGPWVGEDGKEYPDLDSAVDAIAASREGKE